LKKYLYTLLITFFCVTGAFSENKNCEQLKNTLSTFRTEHHIGAMGLYVSTPRVNCYLFSGTISKNNKKPITENNLWQIGSITKSYFSAILLQLEAESESGKIPVKFNINQKLKDWLPQYPAWGNVTVQQLLNMTGGIYSYTELPVFTKMVLKNPKKIWTDREIIALAYNHKPNVYFAPGKSFHYSDTDYVIAGQLIKKIIQKATEHELSLQTIVNNRITKPLNLKNTFYYPDGLPTAILERMVHGYGHINKKDWTNVNLSIAGASGAMIATPEDTAKWVRKLFNGQMLPQKQFTEMQSLMSMKSGKPTKTEAGYALGLANRQYTSDAWGYMGATWGYVATYFYVPKDNAIIVLTANQSTATTNYPITIAHMMKQLVTQIKP